MAIYSRTRTPGRQRLSTNLRPESPPLTPSAGVSTIAAEVLEVTSVDIRCVVAANPAIGETIRIGIDGPMAQCAAVEGIVHWKELRRDKHEIGLFLPGGLPDDLFESLTDVQRQSNRYRCRVPGSFRLDTGGQESEALIVNYSYGGFAIQTSAHCCVDDLMTVAWSSKSGPGRISGQILWQIEQLSGVLVGCQTGPGAGYRIAGLNIA